MATNGYETEQNLFKKTDDVTGTKQKISELRQLVNQAQEGETSGVKPEEIKNMTEELKTTSLKII